MRKCDGTKPVFGTETEITTFSADVPIYKYITDEYN